MQPREDGSAKTHKCVEVARRQIRAGALGVCVATVPEAEVMTSGKIKGILLTSPLATEDKIQRMARLAEEATDLMMVVDHPRQVELYQETAESNGNRLNLLIDIDVGDQRTGVISKQSALELAETVERSRNLNFMGLQAYSGSSSHVVGFENRKIHSRKAMALALEVRGLLAARGIPVKILSGGSTGTYNIDTVLSGLTELQVGSYIYMDLDYHRIGGLDGSSYEDFNFSLTVLTSVVSTNHPHQVTLDAGLKSFSTDRPFVPVAKNLSGVNYAWKGDEFGALIFSPTNCKIHLGDRLEFFVPHCDPTVNLYDRVHVCRGDEVIGSWPIMNRPNTNNGHQR